MSEVQVPTIPAMSQDRLARLREVIGEGPVLILTHDNPDPDGLASGKALATLFKVRWGIPVRLVYSGLVTRAENNAMLRLLTPEWEHAETLDNLAQFSALALVDSQPGAGNNNLPEDITPHIVIDHHHPLREGVTKVPFVDIRPDVGATSSMAYQYLEAAGIEPRPSLATAMFYGIQTDTRGLSRGDSALDQAVYFQLLSLIDRRALVQIEQAGLPRDYFQALNKGLRSTRIYGRAVVSYLEEMHRPDFVAEMADLLVRLEEAKMVLCMGCHDKTLYLSLRLTSDDQDAGIMIQQIIIPPGKAGGHGAMAGGQISLGVDEPVGRLVAEVERRFLAVVGAAPDAKPLLR